MDLVDASHDRRSVALQARAKLNLTLAVGSIVEPAGLHPVSSWMARLDLADELHVTRLEDDRLSRYAILWHEHAPLRSTIDWSITNDLAVRAHLLLEERIGRNLPVQMKLEKRIPVGAGLAGGSADAAAMLRAVNELFELGKRDDELREMAMMLGSDVAFCVGNGAAVVEGFGESIAPAPCERSWVVLVLPEFGCATEEVYRAFDQVCNPDRTEERSEAVRRLAAGGRVDAGSLFNDLAVAAFNVEPRLAALRGRLEAAAGRPAHLTGSGSALFMLCSHEDDARELALDVVRDCGGPWGEVASVACSIE